MRELKFSKGLSEHLKMVAFLLFVLPGAMSVAYLKSKLWLSIVGAIIAIPSFAVLVALYALFRVVLIKENEVTTFYCLFGFGTYKKKTYSINDIKSIEVCVNSNFFASSTPTRSAEIFFNLRSGEALYIPGLVFAYPESVERIRINYLNIQARLNLPSVIYDGACKTIDEFCEFENQ